MKPLSKDSIEGPQPAPRNARFTWLKRIGIAGFLFFLLKGIAWLVFFYFGGAAVLKGC